MNDKWSKSDDESLYIIFKYSQTSLIGNYAKKCRKRDTWSPLNLNRIKMIGLALANYIFASLLVFHTEKRIKFILEIKKTMPQFQA
jgi:hypothetical protein